jgi:hypothetical protein
MIFIKISIGVRLIGSRVERPVFDAMYLTHNERVLGITGLIGLTTPMMELPSLTPPQPHTDSYTSKFLTS